MLVLGIALLVILQPLLAGATTHSPTGGGGGNDYGSAAVMEELFGSLELHRQEQAILVGEELALLRQLHDGKIANFSLLKDQRQALAELNATEEVNASVDMAEMSWEYGDRGFTPVVVDDPQPQQARIIGEMIENEEMWQDTTLGTAASLFLQTYLIYWAYDANGDGNISAEEEGIEEKDLITTLFGSSTSLLSAWVNATLPPGNPFVDIFILLISTLDESDISWVNIDVTGDGNDDVRCRLVPIIGNLIEQSDANPFDGDVQLGAEGGISFEFEKLPGVELDQPLEIAVIRGATYTGDQGEDLTYIWTVDTQFHDVPDTYDWEGTTDDFAIYLNASGINPGDLSSLNAPYNLRYHINADQSNSSDNGVERLTITPGYIKYNWSRGGTPEEPLPAMEEMSFVRLNISNPERQVLDWKMRTRLDFDPRPQRRIVSFASHQSHPMSRRSATGSTKEQLPCPSSAFSRSRAASSLRTSRPRHSTPTPVSANASGDWSAMMPASSCHPKPAVCASIPPTYRFRKPCISVWTSSLKCRTGWCSPAVNLAGTPASRAATMKRATCSGAGNVSAVTPPQRSFAPAPAAASAAMVDSRWSSTTNSCDCASPASRNRPATLATNASATGSGGSRASKLSTLTAAP